LSDSSKLDPANLPFDYSHLHEAERNRIRKGQFTHEETLALLRDENPWPKSGKQKPTHLTSPRIPEPTRDDLLKIAHAEYREQLASGTLPAKNAEQIWAALRKQWYEGHQSDIAGQAESEPEPQRTEPESELAQTPDDNKKNKPDTWAEFHQDPTTGKVSIRHHSPHDSHAARLPSQKLTGGEVWAEVKKHRGWYLLVFLLSGLPVYIATLWGPFMGSKTIPEWLAENGLPSLRVLIIGWIVMAAVVALVIVARAYQTARYRQETRVTQSHQA
jgi:hypothetical protein